MNAKMVDDNEEPATWRPLAAQGLTCHQEGPEMVVLNRQQEQIHQLSETASEIFKLCDGSRTPQQLAEHLCSQYEVDQAQAEHDVRQLLDELKAKRLIA